MAIVAYNIKHFKIVDLIERIIALSHNTVFITNMQKLCLYKVPTLHFRSYEENAIIVKVPNKTLII